MCHIVNCTRASVQRHTLVKLAQMHIWDFFHRKKEFIILITSLSSWNIYSTGKNEHRNTQIVPLLSMLAQKFHHISVSTSSTAGVCTHVGVVPSILFLLVSMLLCMRVFVEDDKEFACLRDHVGGRMLPWLCFCHDYTWWNKAWGGQMESLCMGATFNGAFAASPGPSTAEILTIS